MIRDYLSIPHTPLNTLLHSIGLENKCSEVGNFCAGAFAGFTSALITHPFDVIKTRKQIDSKAVTSTWSGLIKTEGYQALGRGLALRLSTVLPGGAVMVTVYEYVKTLTMQNSK